MTCFDDRFIPCHLLNRSGEEILLLHHQYHQTTLPIEQQKIFSVFRSKIASNYGPCRMAFENADSLSLEEKLCKLVRFTVEDQKAFDQIAPAVQDYLSAQVSKFDLTRYRPVGKNKSMMFCVNFVFRLSTEHMSKHLSIDPHHARAFIYGGASEMLSIITLPQIKNILKDPQFEYMPRYHKAHVEITHQLFPAKNSEIILQTSFLIPFFWISYNRDALDYVCEKMIRLEQFLKKQEIFG